MSRDSVADAALRNLERLMAKDPLLRDIVDPVLPRAGRGARSEPDVDVLEHPDRYEVLVEVPGTPREALKIELDGSRLVVSGDKPGLRQGARVRVGERGSGPFRREFLLPAQVDPTGIRARLEQGILRISLPRGGDGGPRVVDIEPG